MVKGRIRVQLIGNDLNIIRHSLNRAGIYTEDIIRTGNPLGFVSLTDEKKESVFPKEIEAINHKVTQLTLKKNLNEFLSHDESVFRSNFIEHGKTVRYKNTSSYVVVCNTNLLNPLLLYKNQMYSDVFPKNAFSEYLQQNGAIDVTSSLCFNIIKKYFDKYIEILLNEYDRKHIILVRTAPSLWYLEGGSFKQFDDEIQKLRSFIIEADNYFIEKTHCVVVDSFERFVPDGLEESSLPCACYPDFAYDELSADIISVIQDNNSEKYTTVTNPVNIDEIIRLFMLAGQAASANSYSKIAFNLLHNNSCPAVRHSLRRYKNNIKFLKESSKEKNLHRYNTNKSKTISYNIKQFFYINMHNKKIKA